MIVVEQYVNTMLYVCHISHFLSVNVIILFTLNPGQPMFILQKIICGYEGSEVECITASADETELTEILHIFQNHLRCDIELYQNFLKEYEEFTTNNPQPPLNLGATASEKEAVSVWFKINQKFIQEHKREDMFFHKDCTLKTLEEMEYSITEVPTPKNVLSNLNM